MSRLLPIAALMLLTVHSARAERSFVLEQPQPSSNDWCRESRDGDSRYERFCEVRPVTIGAPSTLDVETSNGSIAVTGSSRRDVLIEAKVVAQDDTMDEAKSLAKEVQILTDGGRVRADGPRTAGHRSWWVSFRLQAPTRQNTTVSSSNGSVTLTNLDGTLRADTSNGSVHATDLAGDVRLSTSNGSLQVALSGSTWSGAGLEATTSNGSMRVDMPRDYSAHLTARTGNGSLNVDRPITVTGRIGREIDTDLGKGGPPLRLRTSNGSLSIRER
ncbi:MAG TPA: DUF4097 family beta strand repeat-containing protein [Vicinamibacterales bacterium]|nr:DUF4097 family beta strand repeat-containing protein [Vicinamibacterales bacterium]